MFDTLYMLHPTHGLIAVGTEARPPNASAEKIVERFVLIRTALDKAIANDTPPPRRNQG